MKIQQAQWTPGSGWSPGWNEPLRDAQVVFLFGSPAALRNGAMAEVRRAHPRSHLFGCSTAGEILGTGVHDETLVATAVRFEQTRVVVGHSSVRRPGESYEAGRTLAGVFPIKDLVHIFVLSDGIGVNGSELVKGLTSALPAHVSVTGGLSGDGDRFRETLVMSNGEPAVHAVSAMAFYGSRLKVGCASMGGWDPFGPERIVTRSRLNVVYELDGRPALDLYKQYLGEHAEGLPATGLLFPLSVRVGEEDTPVVRTILSVSEADGSLTFAGDVCQGGVARLMKANYNRLVEGASGAAGACRTSLGDSTADLAILISCVGRKLVLKQRVEEEVEAVRDVLGDQACLTGFYSYGEISPFTPTARCELHNQTMTITTFTEV